LDLPGTATVLPGGHLAIGGLDTIDLAKTYGTPLWIIDEEHFRGNCRAFRHAFRSELFPGGADVVYASKALLTLAICRIVEEEGLSLDVVSGGELHAARMTGFPAERVYFHGSNKSEVEVQEALEAGIGRFMVDSFHEITLLEEATRPGARSANRAADRSRGRPADVILRLAPGIDAGGHDYVRTGLVDGKFGLAISTGQALEAAERILSSPGLRLRGLHCHIGSQIHEVAPFTSAVSVLMDFAGLVLDRTGWVIEEISLGGGFGIRYTVEDRPLAPADYASAISRAVKDKASELGLGPPRVLVEPGRAICATAGWTLYTVGSIKDIPGIRTYVSVDGGMSDDPRPALYAARYEACLANRADEEAKVTVTVAGRCCESGDMLIHDLPLPEPAPGDILAVSCTGAYNYTMAMNYNRLPKPAMILVNRGRADVIVRRETYEDLAAHEVVPERLRR
jgi:diaminopimelate decarboxylase